MTIIRNEIARATKKSDKNFEQFEMEIINCAATGANRMKIKDDCIRAEKSRKIDYALNWRYDKIS